MSPTSMPTTDQEYKLVHLTDPQIIDFTRWQNSLAWKGALSQKDYVLREYVLSKSKVASSGNNKLYVFMLQSTVDDEPLCSIEMLVRDSLKFEFDDKERQSVKKSDILSGCIGGVFTYPQHRGKGYARVMVDKLVELAKREIVGSDGFTFLYSEIGEYYVKNGFKSFPVDLINVSLKDKEVNELQSPPQVHYELIEYHQFHDLMDKYRAHFENEMIAKVKKDHKTRVAIKPTSDPIDWFHLRAKFITYKLFHEHQDEPVIDFNKEYETIKDSLIHEPKIFGLKITRNEGGAESSGTSVIGFIIWTIDWSETGDETQATILKAVAFDGQDQTVIDLINLAIHQLTHHPVLDKPTANVKIWESEISEGVKQQLVGTWSAETGVDNSSRSAILINNPAGEEQLRQGNLIWEENTKLPWF
ncbi:hypothetical protein CANMA_003450 [Candida margitis]|uniref:uncharacterized protein n=1 Tax=Candida margitis TaxID=1775924 RepID=UPI0022269881|nr:uncharacterized protein CANMA_003450 [Candida margitis]KAI5964940.1 hypothetical protein CANMA_003450 [Candida margitis]